MNGHHYILDADGNPQEVDIRTKAGMTQWAAFLQDMNACRVKLTEFGKDVRVSTVFLGIDYRFESKGSPILWETLVFGFPDGHELAGACGRYTSRSAAIHGHDAMCAKVQLARIAIDIASFGKEGT